MKLLLTLDFPPEKGGIQRYLFEKVAHTYTPEDKVFVGARHRPSGKALPSSLSCFVSVHANPFSLFNKKWSIVNLFLQLVAHYRYLKGPGTVVECGNVYVGIAPWLFSFFRPLKYRVYTYGGELLCLHGRRNSLKAVLLRAVLQRAETIFVLGKYAAQLLENTGVTAAVRIEPPRIALTENRLPEKKVLPDSARLGLLCVGRLVPHKGHAVLLKAVSLLPPDCDWRLVLAGSGPEEKNLQAIANALNIASRITLRTTLDDNDLEREYRQADIFVLPSIQTKRGAEGFGIVLLEAAAHGLPIVASRIGGIPEVLDNGGCGILVEPGDPQALKDALYSLARNTGLRKQLSAKAFARVREHYAW